MNLRPFLTITCVAAALIASACREPQTVPPHGFLLLQAPLQGEAGRPAKPTDLTALFRAEVQEIELGWTGSVDPDTGASNLVYRVYYYLDGPPQEYYRTQDLLGESVLTNFYVASGAFTGALYFVVTAFDGTAESEPSDTAKLDLLPDIEETK